MNHTPVPYLAGGGLACAVLGIAVVWRKNLAVSQEERRSVSRARAAREWEERHDPRA